ncbi:hypothetical protein [Azospirillum cavernae]|uniref:hypothetical protein n=1 Tax=Azospirillum cavernae TaxID=2320860 RepID=UPI0011C44206|nr:hypothetical protein [Azospirillum cavernae]
MASFTGDGAYNRPTTVYAAVHERHPAADVTRAAARGHSSQSHGIDGAKQHIHAIAETGRRAWQRDSGYTVRARVENQIGRFKQIVGNHISQQSKWIAGFFVSGIGQSWCRTNSCPSIRWTCMR